MDALSSSCRKYNITGLGEQGETAVIRTGNASIRQSVISQSGYGRDNKDARLSIVCLALVDGTWAAVGRAPLSSPPIEKNGFWEMCVFMRM